jgi:hypothetical protein
VLLVQLQWNPYAKGAFFCKCLSRIIPTLEHSCTFDTRLFECRQGFDVDVFNLSSHDINIRQGLLILSASFNDPCVIRSLFVSAAGQDMIHRHPRRHGNDRPWASMAIIRRVDHHQCKATRTPGGPSTSVWCCRSHLMCELVASPCLW